MSGIGIINLKITNLSITVTGLELSKTCVSEQYTYKVELYFIQKKGIK